MDLLDGGGVVVDISCHETKRNELKRKATTATIEPRCVRAASGHSQVCQHFTYFIINGFIAWQYRYLIRLVVDWVGYFFLKT